MENEFREFIKSVSDLKAISSKSSFVIHGSELLDSCPLTLSSIFLNPLETLESCGKILSEVTQRSNMKFRLSSMPPIPELIRSTVPRSCEAGYFLSFLGTVVKSGGTKVVEWLREYQCKKCGSVENLKAEFEMYQAFNPPKICSTCNAGPQPWKTSSKLRKPKPEYCKDYQEIKVQEQIRNLGLGTVPRSVWVALEDDLVDSCKPGDDVLVIGTVCRRWKGLGKAPEERTDIELIIRANFIQVQNDEKSKFLLSQENIDEFKAFWKKHQGRCLIGRNYILSSFCPQVYGLFIVKLAVAVILAGGVERIDESGTRVRGESHLLMVGDPGTGKSQILKYASRLSQRSVMTTGMGSTSAGLTVSAVKAGGVWNLEAGALVLADGGICCIDEFNGIRESDRTCIHEAMEQQSLSIAKAGLVCKLQTRCSVLAAANPKGSYDPEQPLSVNIAVASPLLSRFDLVLILMDLKNERWDELVSSYLLNGQKPFASESKGSHHFWTLDHLRSYFSHIKTINPEMTADVSQIISRYYQRQRSNEYVNMSRTTVRLLQSIVRLSQGHARLLHHTKIEVVDVVNAILLIEASGGVPSSSSLIVNNSTNTLHSTFPANPLADYYEQARSVLLALNLEDLWKVEEERLRKVSEEENNSCSGEFDKTVELNNPIEQDKDSDQKMVLTQVMSKLKNKFSFVETVVPKGKKKKSKGTTVSRNTNDSDDSSSGECDLNISEMISSTFKEKVSSSIIGTSSDESDFEVTHQKTLGLRSSKQKATTSKSSNPNLSEEKFDYSFDFSLSDNENPKKKKDGDSSLSDLDLSLNSSDVVSQTTNEINVHSALRSSGASLSTNEVKRKRSESMSSPDKRRRSVTSKETELQSVLKNSQEKTENEVTLSSKTLNRFKQFSVPTSSPESSQPKVLKSLADIFSQSQDEDLDLEI